MCWLTLKTEVATAAAAVWPDPDLKNPDIQILHDYKNAPPHTFWNSFPKSTDYAGHSGVVKRSVLKRYVQKCWFSWTLPERNIAKKALKRLKGEAVRLSHELPSVVAKNTNSAIENGKWITDTLATWIKKGFVMGPFFAPPFKHFRSNPLMAAVQRSKIRPILNLSSPKNRSFNDAVDPWHIEKLNMSSPRLFGESLIKMGPGATFSKSDIQDAYKVIPNAKHQHHLYGMKWLGKFFYDKTTVFGSAAAPAWFDPFSALLVNIVCTMNNIPKKYVHRQLDDVPMASPKNSNLTERFHSEYNNLCKKINLPLATPCQQKEKAFPPTTSGTVLGTRFDSETLSWSLSAEKAQRVLLLIDSFLLHRTCSLKDIQRLIGKLTDFSQMNIFMKGFKYNLLCLLHKFKGLNKSKKLIPQNVKSDLHIWKQAILSAQKGLPIPGLIEEPPLCHLTFISDAAGAVLKWKNGKCFNYTTKNSRGAASIGYEGENITFVGLIRWPDSLLTTTKSLNNKLFGSKSTTLETIGILIPFLTISWKLWGCHIILEVDNTAVRFGWQKRYSKNDPETSVLLRALHVIEAFLHCRIYIKHVKRISTPMATLADQLSRDETFSQNCKDKIAHLKILQPTGSITNWLQNPTINWDLSLRLIEDIKNLI
jgi:hypothetical protein